MKSLWLLLGVRYIQMCRRHAVSVFR